MSATNTSPRSTRRRVHRRVTPAQGTAPLSSAGADEAPKTAGSASPPNSMQTKAMPTFRELGVAAEIVDALSEQGITRTFAIQELTLPLALMGTDVIGQARTGMGKTLGFGVPLLDRIFDDASIKELDGTPRALVIVPTRELAAQVGHDLACAATYLPVRILTIYGGVPYEEHITQLHSGVDVVVGTPGRLIDLYERGDLVLDDIALLVLDEADEMLNLGFLPSVERLLSALTHEHQTMLFSATMPGPILSLARGFLHNPVHIRAESPTEDTLHEDITQIVLQAHRLDKTNIVKKILQIPSRGRTILFTTTKADAAWVATHLAEAGFLVGAVHGDMQQAGRERALRAFRTGVVDILVATDVAARGIDVDDVSHVINYSPPKEPDTYVHRVGRTGRAGHTGIAITLVGFEELRAWKFINDTFHIGIPEPPIRFSTSPELYEELGIPTDASDSVGPPQQVFGGAAAVKPAHAAQKNTKHIPNHSRSSRMKRAAHGTRSALRHSSSDTPTQPVRSRVR